MLVPLYDSCVPVAGWLASWGHLPVCVLFVCLCLGRSSGAPSPRDPCCLCRGPKACTLFVCPSPVVLSVVNVCSLVLWPVCPCACVAVLVCESTPPVCPYGICLSIPVSVLCPQLSPREGEDSTAAPPINLDLTIFLQSDSSEVGFIVTPQLSWPCPQIDSAGG